MVVLVYLDEEKHSSRGVKGTVVEGDDGGAMSSKQVGNLHNSQRRNSVMKRCVSRSLFLRWDIYTEILSEFTCMLVRRSRIPPTATQDKAGKSSSDNAT